MCLYTDLKPGPYIKLTVSDTGQGMDYSVLEHIFEPYFTTKERGKGAGMGLSVVHGIVKNHSGDIKVYSEKGKGATFDILFPRLIDKTCEEEKQEKEIPTVDKSKRILFIDDEQALVDIGKLSLKKMGYNVFATTSCVEALKIFSEEPFDFDLVITDQTMPEMSGLELIKKLRDIRMDIPVILCTGHSDYINEKNAHLSGIKKLLMKPFTSRALMEGIQSVIN
jgi:CheY-like chemotaxis protein